MDAFAFNCIEGATEGPDIIFAVALNVGPCNLHSKGIDIAGEDLLCAQEPRRNRKNSRTGTHVKDNLFGLEPPLERLNRQLCRFVSASAECLPGVDSDRKPIIGDRSEEHTSELQSN